MASEGKLIGSELGAVHFERRVLWLAIAVAVPGALVAFVLLWSGSLALVARVSLTAAIIVAWPGLALLEFNRLGSILADQRLTALDASALARAVMREINVAVFVFDEDTVLRLINRAAERLIGQPSERAIGKTASALDIEECLSGDSERAFEREFLPGVSKWQLRRTAFRQGGRPHQLVVLADLRRALREEERMAWQRLLRVLGHEINNSLAPIQSLSDTLREHVKREPRPDDWQEDLDRGLEVIGGRSASLARFMASYTLLARMPAPTFAPIEVTDWIGRIARMETRLKVA